MPSKNFAQVDRNFCVACGSCVKVCPKGAISVWRGVTATVETSRCIGCGKCARECPAGAIRLMERESVQ